MKEVTFVYQGPGILVENTRSTLIIEYISQKLMGNHKTNMVIDATNFEGR